MLEQKDLELYCMTVYRESGKMNISLKERSWLPICSILGLATVFYLYDIGEESFWLDEFYSVRDANNVFTQFSLTRPLYFALLNIWMLLGQGDVWLRLLSVPFALGSIFLIYLLGQRLLGKPQGLVAALVLACSPLFVRQAQEVRMYTLSTFLVLAGTLCLTYLFEKPSIKTWASWLLLRILAVLTTPLNVLMLLPDVTLILWKFRQQKRTLALLLGILTLLTVIALPWGINFFRASIQFFGGWASEVEELTPVRILSRLTSLTAFFPLRSITAESVLIFYQFYTLVITALLLIGIFSGWKENRKNIILIGTWAFLPSAAMITVSWLFAPIWEPRYLLFIAPYFFLIVAHGFIRTWTFNRIIAFVITLIYIPAFSGGLHHHYSTDFGVDWRQAATLIEEQDQPDDIIAMYSRRSKPEPFIARYYDGEAPVHMLDPENWESSFPSTNSRLWIVFHNTFYYSNAEIESNFYKHVQDNYNIDYYEQLPNEEPGLKSSIDIFLVSPK